MGSSLQADKKDKQTQSQEEEGVILAGELRSGIRGAASQIHSQTPDRDLLQNWTYVHR